MPSTSEMINSISKNHLENMAESLDKFWDYAMFDQRYIQPSDGILMALEFGAIQQGLIPRDFYDMNFDSAVFMTEFVSQLRVTAKGMPLANWTEIEKNLPYIYEGQVKLQVHSE